MKRALALALIVAFCAAVGLANTGGDKATEATITRLDMAAKSMVVKTSDGKELTVYWNDATSLQGTLKEGEIVHIKTSEKDGRLLATWIHVGKLEKK
jgi:hypothetical protein